MPDLPDSSDLITFGMRDENAPHSWNNAPLNSLLKNGKELFVLGGNGNQWSRDGNAMTKVGISFLGDDYKKFNVFGAYYRNGTNKTPYVAMRSMFLIDNILVPQIATKDKFGNLHRLPFEEAWRNMRKKVFLTHCHGGRIVREATKQINNIHSRLDEIMLSIGYSEKEAEVIHRQMVVFHQNNPCADIGIGPTRSIEFYRITQADEQNRPVVYNTDSFGYYLATEQMAEHDIYYAALSENERAFIIPKISPYKKSEHNGAYWQVPRKEKYESAQIEEDMFLAFFKEITSTDYMIENMSQIEENVMKKNPHLRQTFKEMQDDGDDFMENYRGYRQNVQEEFNEAKEKLLQGKFSSADGAEISQEALFLHDSEGHNLLDLAVQKGDVAAVAVIWKNMLEAMPPFEYGKDLKNIYQDFSNDMLETKKKHQFYTTHAFDTNNKQMFLALAQNNDALVGLDYLHASAEMALCAVKKFCDTDWNDENISLPALDLIYGKNLEFLIRRCRQPDMANEETKKLLPDLIKKRQRLIKREGDFISSVIQDVASGRGSR
ncbi:MAG: hypothetical protein J6N45_03435 [Alphaproteobacteria bacterium]|nr:hypothetical protein [Alphaproteobacteria bacterium]